MKTDTHLEDAVAYLYKVFSKHKRPKKMIQTECAVCFTFEDETALLSTPLTELNQHLFGALFTACNITDIGAKKFIYFIPRILELLLHEGPDYSDSFFDNVFETIGKFHFSPREIKAIHSFLTLYLENEFSDSEQGDSAEIFHVDLSGFDSISFLSKQKAFAKDWGRIEKDLLNYIDVVQKHAAKFKNETFEQWLAKGNRKQLLDFLLKEKHTI